MSSVTEAGMGQGARGDVQRVEQRVVGERETRWSARRKEGLVMRLLRGESLDLLARESGQPAGRISAWREEFLAAGREGLKARPLPVEDPSAGGVPSEGWLHDSPRLGMPSLFQGRPYNPKVAGSNPAPAMTEYPRPVAKIGRRGSFRSRPRYRLTCDRLLA